MKELAFSIIIIAVLLFSVWYFFPSSAYCEKYEDCVPTQCCHPTSCVNKLEEPDCTGIGCTDECRPGTMDCGCGSCVCQDNRCIISWVNETWC